MPVSLIDAESLLAIDVGTVTTQATLFDVVEGHYRFIAAGQAPTTAAAPFRDISEGVHQAIENLQNITGRMFFSSDYQLIMPMQEGVGVGSFAATISAGPALKTVVVGLLGDFLLIPLLEKVDGLRFLRVSVVLELLLFPAFLLVAWPWLKLVLVGLLGFFNSGWYAILKGRLYSTLPGQSGTVMALDNVFGLVGGLLPFGIGLAADAFGLQVAIWLLLAGPIALLVGLPRLSFRVEGRR